MSNVFSVREIENKYILVPLNIPGVERLLKVGARVKFREDLILGRLYGGLPFCGYTLNFKEKIMTIKEITKEHIFMVKEETIKYWHTKEMLKGVYLN